MWSVSYCSVRSIDVTVVWFRTKFITQLLRNFLLRNFTKEILSIFTGPYVWANVQMWRSWSFHSSISLYQRAKYQRVHYRGRYKTVQLIYLKNDRPNGSSETGTTTIYCLLLLLRARQGFSLSALHTLVSLGTWRLSRQDATTQTASNDVRRTRVLWNVKLF